MGRMSLGKDFYRRVAVSEKSQSLSFPRQIVQDLSQLEMPGLTRIATTLALFKTYAIVSDYQCLTWCFELYVCCYMNMY